LFEFPDINRKTPLKSLVLHGAYGHVEGRNIANQLPSGKHGKSPFSVGKTSSNGGFSIAMLVSLKLTASLPLKMGRFTQKSKDRTF